VNGLGLNDRGFISNSAQIRSDGDVDKSRLSPAGSPGVSNDPISSRLSVVGISD